MHYKLVIFFSISLSVYASQDQLDRSHMYHLLGMVSEKQKTRQAIIKYLDIHDLAFEIYNQKNHIMALAIAPHNNYLACASRSINLFDLKTGELIRELCDNNQSTGYIVTIAFSPDSNYLAAADSSARIRMWECNSGNIIKTVYNQADHYVHKLQFSPDGCHLFVLGQKNATAWDTKQWRHFSLGGFGLITALASSPDNRLLALSIHERIWIYPGIESPDFYLPDITFMIKSTLVIACLEIIGIRDKRVQNIIVFYSQPKKMPNFHLFVDKAVAELKFSKNAQTVSAFGDTHVMRTWDLKTSKVDMKMVQDSNINHMSVANPKKIFSFAVNSTYAVSGTMVSIKLPEKTIFSGNLVVYDYLKEEFKNIFFLDDLAPSQWHIVISDNGEYIASANKTSIKIWRNRALTLMVDAPEQKAVINKIKKRSFGKPLMHSTSFSTIGFEISPFALGERSESNGYGLIVDEGQKKSHIIIESQTDTESTKNQNYVSELFDEIALKPIDSIIEYLLQWF